MLHAFVHRPYQAPPAAGEVVAPLLQLDRRFGARPDLRVVEYADVGREAGGEASAILDAPEISGMTGHPLDGLFERNRLPGSRPGPAHVGDVAGVVMHIDMGAAVGQPNQQTWIGDEF